MPIAVLTRGFITDAIRSFALKEGNTPFEMMTRRWARTLTSSRTSRFLSGASKMCAFLAMALLLAIKTHQIHIQQIEKLQTATSTLAITAVAICLLRGVPVMIDGIKHIKAALNHQSYI